MDIGPQELLILALVLLVIFGGSQVPKLARNLGKAQSEFKKGLSEGKGESKGDGSKDGSKDGAKAEADKPAAPAPSSDSTEV